MQWSDFYDNYYDWAESTIRSRISSLKEMGPADEVVDAILDLPTEQLKVQLIRKAIKHHVEFSHDDFLNLDAEFPMEVYRELAAYAGFDADYPLINEKNLLWDDFYMEHDGTWDEETLSRRISLLKDIGPGDEVEDIIRHIQSDEIKTQLIRKAIELQAKFTQDDFEYLADELPADLLRELADYATFDADHPDFDEDNMEWDDFHSACTDWSEKLTLQRIAKLDDFGPTEEVCEAILLMPTSDCETALYERAKACGVKFSAEQLEEIGQVEIDVKVLLDDFATALEENVAVLCEEIDHLQQIQQAQKRQRRAGFFGLLFGILGAFAGAGNRGKKHHSRRCDGNCANCPPHYGYRYGRWYYGHGHMRGCQRGGNGGASGRTHRD